MTYTKEDLERVERLSIELDAIPGPEDVAQLIADVRREERERCAQIADDYYVSSVAGAIAVKIRRGLI
jgi:hypothetical protein